MDNIQITHLSIIGLENPYSAADLAGVETDSVHLQPLGVLQEVHLGLGWALALVQLVQLRYLSVQLGRVDRAGWAVGPQ